MLRTEAYASQMGTLSVARRLFGNVARGTTSLRGRRLKGKGKGVFGVRETRGPGRARREGRKETPVSFPPSSRAPRVSLAPKTPCPLPFKRLPRRLALGYCEYLDFMFMSVVPGILIFKVGKTRNEELKGTINDNLHSALT